MTPIFLAMMWRNADGSLTIAFWWAVVLSAVFIGAGIWSLVAPESMRFHYFNALNWRRRERGLRLLTPSDAWGWSSSASIRFAGVVAIAMGAGFMTWIAFFTAPGVAY